MSVLTSVPPKERLILGVDPGLSGGALALYSLTHKRLKAVVDMPLREERRSAKGDGRQVLDIHSLANWIDPFAKAIVGAVIENVGARPGQGVTSMFRFGYASGVVAGVVGAFYIPIHFAEPAVWKSLMHLSHDKETSVVKACEMFPEHAGIFRGPQGGAKDGRAEAALLSVFGGRIFK